MDQPSDQLPAGRGLGVGWFVLLVLPLMLLTLPITLPIAVFQMRRDERRRRAVARMTGCAQCGTVLGEPALDRADAAWAAYVERLHRDRPGIRFRLVRKVHAVCTVCGAEYRWDREGRRFEVEGMT